MAKKDKFVTPIFYWYGKYFIAECENCDATIRLVQFDENTDRAKCEERVKSTLPKFCENCGVKLR